MASEFELNDDGTAVIRSGGSEWTLRRPTLGEYRKAFEIFEGADDRLQTVLAAIPDDKVKDRLTAANHLQLGEDGSDPLYAQVLCAFIGLVGTGGDVPSPDDMPAWAVSADPCAQLLRHWRAVPLARGVPE